MTDIRLDSPLAAKLACGVALSAEDRRQIDLLCAHSAVVESHRNLISQGDPPHHVHLVLEGMACRFKTTGEGARSIFALLIPGDFCDLNIAILGRMDHAIATLTRTRIVRLPRATIDEIMLNHPRVARALWWSTLVDEATLREWLVNMGRRSTIMQMAHLFCELFVRMDTIGMVRDGAYPLPLSQEELADVLGISTVHANRTLQELRRLQLLGFSRQRVQIPDFQRLADFATFDPDYLHLAGSGSHRKA